MPSSPLSGCESSCRRKPANLRAEGLQVSSAFCGYIERDSAENQPPTLYGDERLEDAVCRSCYQGIYQQRIPAPNLSPSGSKLVGSGMKPSNGYIHTRQAAASLCPMFLPFLPRDRRDRVIRVARAFASNYTKGIKYQRPSCDLANLARFQYILFSAQFPAKFCLREAL